MTLTVTSELGCVESITKTIYIPGPQPYFEFDLAGFQARDTAEICVGELLELVNKSAGDINTPKFIIESDATIVAPLIFAYLLKF